jgi:polyphosphate kinase 2 (PPK2 family)
MKIKDYHTFNPEWDKGKTRAETKTILKEIGELQYKMYAQQKYSLLIVFQGLDASGKDGLTRGLLRYCNPIGIKIKSFKKPTPEEFAHDFLWRVHKDGDWETRKKFSDYQEVYERIFRDCNAIPWHIVPSDKNWQKLYYVASEVLKTLKSIELEWPELESELFT